MTFYLSITVKCLTHRYFDDIQSKVDDELLLFSDFV